MSIAMESEVARMRQLTVSELRARFVEFFGEPPHTRHKEHLVRWNAIGTMATRICEVAMATALAAFEEFDQPRAEAAP